MLDRPVASAPSVAAGIPQTLLGSEGKYGDIQLQRFRRGVTAPLSHALGPVVSDKEHKAKHPEPTVTHVEGSPSRVEARAPLVHVLTPIHHPHQ
jgi:hypothetical protein